MVEMEQSLQRQSFGWGRSGSMDQAGFDRQIAWRIVGWQQRGSCRKPEESLQAAEIGVCDCHLDQKILEMKEHPRRRSFPGRTWV